RLDKTFLHTVNCTSARNLRKRAELLYVIGHGGVTITLLKKIKTNPASESKSDAEPRPFTAREKELQELRQFDQDWRCGDCTGTLQQPSHAQHGLNPPQEIRYMLFSTDTDYTLVL
uniref:Uncharacterized protein n=1 Tax=Salmo trutta TaxID=8032 RepID=A0A674DXR4_SALTR